MYGIDQAYFLSHMYAFTTAKDVTSGLIKSVFFGIFIALIATYKGFDADEGKGWYNGRTVWVPLNEVSQIVEFQDRGDLIKASENRRAAAK